MDVIVSWSDKKGICLVLVDLLIISLKGGCRRFEWVSGVSIHIRVSHMLWFEWEIADGGWVCIVRIS